MSWLDEIKQRDGVERWLELVETLRTVTEGKVRRACLSPRVAGSLPYSYSQPLPHPFSSF